MADALAGAEACDDGEDRATVAKPRLRLWSPPPEPVPSRLEVSADRMISVSTVSRMRRTGQKARPGLARSLGSALDPDRAALALAGVMVLAGVALAWFVNPAFIWLTVAAGATMLQGAFTGLSLTAMVLRLIGVKSAQPRRRSA